MDITSSARDVVFGLVFPSGWIREGSASYM
jgi:hypothetical protein